MLDIFILNDNHQVYDQLVSELPYISGKINGTHVDEAVIVEAANASRTEFFYLVVSSDISVSSEYRFDCIPDEYSSEYVHVWADGMEVRLYSKRRVLNSPASYTDSALSQGIMKIKKIDDCFYQSKPYDIIFLSFQDPLATLKLHQLRERFPRAKHVSDIPGILNAHRQAALESSTTMFYVVDSDALLWADFDFSYQVQPGQNSYVHVWRAYNHSILLAYGYGGIKLFPTMKVRNAEKWELDFTTSLGTGCVLMPDIISETVVNETPFTAWRSAFRETAKLASSRMPDDKATSLRLRAWLNPNELSDHWEMIALGAKMGKEYGLKHQNNMHELMKINDYQWLSNLYLNTTTSVVDDYYNYFWRFK